MLKKKKILTLLLFSVISYAESAHIEVDISEQRLYLIENSLIKASYPISTSKYGEGSIENSFKTPLGKHSIKEMIGEEAEINTIFTSRINTKRSATIIDQFEDTDNDYVTSRIMWLDGEEDGLNKGGNVDSFRRYIYIHGTHEEGLIGTKASHGCIRMFNYDVIELFNLVNIGTKVLIRA
ncbi:MAG: L,D-transpeptidase [Proteobacteria bacterium]|jgi:lipoprotein-anchoring transpeptidase ErfK/SrfK|nr:L,D-transpeptidase [Pseudomonadota bacterium]NCV45871.1 L,D-transpeptidase [Pseudomonadota bacterium]NCV99628.1 L,D-transpeptidase [Pseudomonadota bacterium]NCW38439.1 L,D-transpeptidase [Pseudomonadota bacterium]NCX42340.1 L,D-transpeptidase [Pseudomonadota bacterium]|tara:strand:+ start:1401 stop:1940 length:540 start_codon:yes stop_codon:yes gene_type:complete